MCGPIIEKGLAMDILAVLDKFNNMIFINLLVNALKLLLTYILTFSI